MARKEVKKDLVGASIKVSPAQTIVLSQYMSDDEYEFVAARFPDYFEQPKKVKKNDSNKQ